MSPQSCFCHTQNETKKYPSLEGAHTHCTQFHCRTRLSQQFEVANETSRYASFMKHQYLGLRISISDPFCFYELNNLFVNCERYNVARKPSQNTLLRIAMFNGLAFPLLFFWVPRWVDIYSIPCVFLGPH